MFMWLGTHVGSQPPFLVAGESSWVLWRFLGHRMVPMGSHGFPRFLGGSWEPLLWGASPGRGYGGPSFPLLASLASYIYIYIYIYINARLGSLASQLGRSLKSLLGPPGGFFKTST